MIQRAQHNIFDFTTDLRCPKDTNTIYFYKIKSYFTTIVIKSLNVINISLM